MTEYLYLYAASSAIALPTVTVIVQEYTLEVSKVKSMILSGKLQLIPSQDILSIGGNA